MGSEKGGAKVIGGGGGAGGIFNLFDWKRKSRKKLFSNSPEGAKLVRRSEKTLPSGRLQLVDDDEGIGVTSFKGSSDYSCASSVTDEEGREMKAPGVVARLMGLDALPTSGVPEPYCTPFRDTRSFRDSQSLKRSPEYSMNDQFSYVPRRVDSYMRKPLDFRAQKMPSSPIERFQIEALPPRSAKPLPMSHHRLLSPIKNPGFSSARNAAQIMEEAAKILQPRAQSSSREKICSFSPARIPLRVSEPRESISASQRTVSQRAQSSRNTPELPDVRFSRGQQMSRSWNSEEDIVIFRPSIDSYEINNPSCSKNNKGKSISLAVQAKNNVQKREGASSGRNSGVQKEHDDHRTNQPFRSQSNHQRNKQQKKASSSGTSSPVLRQNSQKQNSLVTRGKVAPNKSVSTQQGRKVMAGDSSSGKIKNGSKVSKGGGRKDIVESITGDREGSSSNNKDFPQKKRLIERNSTNEKGTFVPEKAVGKLQKQVQPNVVMDEHIKWDKESKDTTDVVSFTFTSPLVKPSAGPSRLAGKWDSRSNFNLDAGCDKDDSDSKIEGPSSVGLNFINGDALSLLLEKKLKELTSKIDPSITFTRGDTFVPATFTLEEVPTSSCSNWGSESGVFDCSPSEVKPSQYDYCPSAQSSTKGQIFRGSKLKVEEPEECSSISNARKEQEHEDLSPLSVLEPTFLSESCWSSECLGSSDGSKVVYSSSSEVKTIPGNFLMNPPSVDIEAKTTDSASSASVDTSDISDVTQCSKKSRHTELEYVEDVLSNVNLTTDELASLFVNQDGSALDPLLFEKVENMHVYTQGKEPLGRRGYRRLLFDCVNECLETRRGTYFRAGYAAWSKGVASLSRGVETEVCNEITSWKSMGEWVEDELVDKDMSSGLGTWVDFRVEAFEAGEEVESEILSSVLDEVIGDMAVRRPQEYKFVI
ncbi:hypothetical protein GQ55_3G140800 [Panicum hallii var. hallii]|uniref:DUF4378 domain-containing protein n=1 Tax=Panicum hallii var. hallii TaxID=1504633 RepID=A0A2T7E977_9POAL|nr:hypothetical protein GQ55_3G140800 [Panicum hallii var. hallii]PUZ64395.1 hypothetical protein GQ55_3G140800 [Panicum hallii var. hallii]